MSLEDITSWRGITLTRDVQGFDAVLEAGMRLEEVELVGNELEFFGEDQVFLAKKKGWVPPSRG